MYQEYLADVKRISKNVLEGRHPNDPGNNPGLGQSSTSGAAGQDGQSQEETNGEGSPAESDKSNDSDDSLEEKPTPTICGLREILNGMPEEFCFKDQPPDDSELIMKPKKPRITNPIAEILKGEPLVLDRRASLHARKVFFDELSKTLDKKLGKTPIDDKPQAHSVGMQTSPKEVQPRRYTEMLDSMADAVADMDYNNFNVSDKNSYAKRLDEMVQKSGDAGLIKSWTAKKKRQADRLAFKTRSQAQMVHSMINVKEFTEDSRSYSLWLDNVVPAEDNNRQSSISEEPQTQTSDNSSKRSKGGKSLREPRFREQSAANFLKNSLAEQILQEFGRPKKPKSAKSDISADPSEPRFSEVPAANFLSAVSEQIREKFTDTSDQSQTSDASDGPRTTRFREKSALKFLAALEEQLRPEFKKSGSSERSEGGGTRFREKSAFNFLDALRDQILHSPNQIPPDDGPTSSDLSVLTATVRALATEVIDDDQNTHSEDLDPAALENEVIDNDQNTHSEDLDPTALETEVVESDQDTPKQDPDMSAQDSEVAESDQGSSPEYQSSADQSVQSKTVSRRSRRNSK